MLFVVTGASGSGKSEYAEQLVCSLSERDGITEKIYAATMEKESTAAKERIMRHQKLRAGKGFVTAEAAFGLREESVRTRLPDAVVLLECVSNLLANLMFSGNMAGEAAEREIVSQVEKARLQCRHIVVVTNEIFSDGSVYTGEMEQYVKALGRINCRLAGSADVFCEVVYSVPVFLKGEALCRF